MIRKKQSRIYLDYAAATPVDRRVLLAMEPFAAKNFGNPSALHTEGQVARKAIEDARKEIAGHLDAHSDEVVFTASGTEANNVAILGVAKSFFAQPNASTTMPHIITTEIEHPSILSVIKDLEAKGAARITYIPVSSEGRVNPRDVKDALKDETVLVTIAYANSEIGVIQEIREIAKVVRDWRKDKKTQYPYFHTDACQAVNYLDVSVARLGVDLMSFNAAKIYGPKGVGALYRRRGAKLSPVIYGGGQEGGIRSGTENVSGIVGFAAALTVARSLSEKESKRLSALRDVFIQELCAIPGVRLTGDAKNRLPNNVNVSVSGVRSAELVLRLDAKGVACSSKSACKSSDEEASYVLKALGKLSEEAESSIRFTLGRQTTRRDLKKAVKALIESLETIARAPKLQ